MSELETINDIFWNLRDLSPDRELLSYKEGGPFQEDQDSWCTMTVSEFSEKVYRRSWALNELGVRPQSDIALISNNRPAWHIYDFAIMGLRASTVPIHTNLSPEQTRYILNDSESTHLVVSTERLLKKVLKGLDKFDPLERIILVNHQGDVSHEKVITEEELLASTGDPSREKLASFYREKMNTVRPDDLATLIYTSGTTGDPKGVMLTHHNIVSNLQDCEERFELADAEWGLSFLPISHAFERIVDYSYLNRGVSLAYGSVDTIVKDVETVQPSTFASVPRFFEKMKDKVESKIEEKGGLSRYLFEWALEAGYQASKKYYIEGEKIGIWSKIKRYLANKFVFKKIHRTLGGNLQFAISGGAALDESVCRFFLGLSIPLVEGYGMTEMSPVVTATPLTRIRPGTVGCPLPSVDLEIADDGEILVRGPNMMKGYYRKHEASAEALRGGWFHTGDVGALTDEGYLKVHGRKKSAIVTSWGENIVPQPLESELRKSGLIEHAILIGNNRPFISALIQPNFERLKNAFQDIPPEEQHKRSLIKRSEVQKRYQEEIDRIQEDWADYEQIKQFYLLPEKLTVKKGELTPTMKVRRHVLQENYKEPIEEMYKRSDPEEQETESSSQEQETSEETPVNPA